MVNKSAPNLSEPTVVPKIKFQRQNSELKFGENENLQGLEFQTFSFETK